MVGRFLRSSAVALAAMLAGAGVARAESLLFGIIPVPDESDARAQVIERQPTEAWPFTIDRGVLVCVPVWGERHIYFATDEEPIEVALVSIDPFSVLFGGRRLLRDYDDVMERAEAFAPYVEMGLRLCAQEGGTRIGPGGI